MWALRRSLPCILAAVIFAAPPVLPALAADSGQNDPIEPFNRAMFTLNNNILDKHIVAPAARFYNRRVPLLVRNGVHNFFSNLYVPVTFENDILQLAPRRAGQSAARFVLNTTLGLAGFIDVSTKLGIPAHEEDFGQTLGRYGVGEGPYLVVPLVGPAPPRDLVGRIADSFIDPIRIIGPRSNREWQVGSYVGGMLDERAHTVAETDIVEKSAVDYYATIRSLYRQDRSAAIHNGKVVLDELPDIESEPDMSAPSEPAPAPTPPASVPAPTQALPPKPAPAAPMTQAPPMASASDTMQASVDSAPASPDENAAALAELVASFEHLKLPVASLETRGTTLLVHLQAGAGPLICDKVWGKLQVPSLAGIDTLTVSSADYVITHYQCTKFVPLGALVPASSSPASIVPPTPDRGA